MLSETQKGLLVLLKEIDDICTRHGIDFYLAGGSMIGAVRHGGFLPWDDDADIHMTKEGAEKFISLADEFLPGRIVVSKNTHQDYSAVHWRYMDTNKTTMLRSSFITDVPQGQFIDIFILNPITSDTSKHEEILKNYYLYSEWVVNHFSALSVRDDSLFDEYAKLRKREKTEGFDKVRKELEEKLFEYPGEECDYYLIRSPLAGQPIFHRSLWGKPRRVPFEDCMMPVAEKAEEILMMSYGDRWIDIPELTDQVSHVFVSDQDVPYRIYDDEIKKFADKKILLQRAYNKKDTWFSHSKDRNLANSRSRAATQFAIMEQIRSEKGDTDLEKLIREHDYNSLSTIFQRYYKAQFADFKYYGLYFDLPEEYLYAALLPLVIQGSYSKAAKVFRMRENEGKKLTEKRLSDLSDFCQDAAALTNSVFVFSDYDKASELTYKWLSVYPDCITLLRMEIFLSLKQDNVDILSLRKKIAESLKLYKEDGEMLKYLGDTYRIEGDHEQAKRYYRRSLGTLTNGLQIKEIKKYLETSENA